MAEMKFASDYAREVQQQLQGNIDRLIAAKRAKRQEEEEKKRYEQQQQRLDMQEARALRAEQRQLQLDQEARDQRVIENKYKASADLRAETQMGINLDANERAAQQEQRAADDAFYKQYGITDALAVDMPTGLNQRDQPAVQAAWEQVRKAGRAAMQSKSQEDVAHLEKMMDQWNRISGVAEGRATLNNQNYQNVLNGQYSETLATTVVEETERWEQYNAAPSITVGPDGTIMYVEQVTDEMGTVTTSQVPYTNSRYGDINDIYVPVQKSEESMFNSYDYGTTVAEESFVEKGRYYTVKDEEYALGTGVLNSELLYTDINKNFRAKEKGNIRMMNQISFEAFNDETPGKDYLEPNDLKAALEKYPPEMANIKFGDDQVRAVYGEYDAEGNYNFSVSDSDIENDERFDRDTKDDILNYRKAYKGYREKLARRIEEQVIPLDETHIIAQNKTAERIAQEEAALEAQQAAQEAFELSDTTLTEIRTPSTTNAEGQEVPGEVVGMQFQFPPNENVAVPAAVAEGFNKAVVNDVRLDNQGNVTSVVLGVPKDIMREILQGAGDDQQALVSLQRMFDKVDGKVVSADENPEQFNQIMAVLNDTQPASGKPSPADRLQNAQFKVRAQNVWLPAAIEQGLLPEGATVDDLSQDLIELLDFEGE